MNDDPLKIAPHPHKRRRPSQTPWADAFRFGPGQGPVSIRSTGSFRERPAPRFCRRLIPGRLPKAAFHPPKAHSAGHSPPAVQRSLRPAAPAFCQTAKGAPCRRRGIGGEYPSGPLRSAQFGQSSKTQKQRRRIRSKPSAAEALIERPFRRPLRSSFHPCTRSP